MIILYSTILGVQMDSRWSTRSYAEMNCSKGHVQYETRSRELTEISALNHVYSILNDNTLKLLINACYKVQVCL